MLLFFCTVTVILSSALPAVGYAQQKSQSKQPEVEVVKAVFGKGRSAIRCDKKIRDIIEKPGLITTITKGGLGIKARKHTTSKLRINFRVGEKSGLLTLNNGAKVNLRNEILKAAAKIKPPPPKKVELEIKLPEPFRKVCSGGGGRFLFFQLPKRKKIAVVDLRRRAIVKEIPVADDACFAANQSHLIIASPKLRELQNWSIARLELQKTVALEVDQVPVVAAMGASGNGPLAMWGNGDVQFWDVESLRPLEIANSRVQLENNGRDRLELTASADGKTFCSWVKDSNSPFSVIRIQGEGISVSKTGVNRRSGIYAFPTADGAKVLHHGGVALNFLLRKTATRTFENKYDLLPCEDPRFIIASRPINGVNLEMSICSSTDLKVLHTLPKFESVIEKNSRDSARISDGQRLFYVPGEKLVVCLSKERNRVIYRPFDLKDEMELANEKFVAVISNPPTKVADGDEFTYSLETISSSAVNYSLKSGPDGMTVSSAGIVKWTASTIQDQEIQNVVIEAKNLDGSKQTHSFELVVPNPPQLSIQFPSKYQFVRAGGSGRFMIFHLPDANQLAIVDFEKRKIVKEISVPDEVCFAATRTDLFVGLPREKQLQKWSLRNLEQLASVPLPMDTKALVLGAGSSGNGPLAIWGKGNIEFWDVDQLKRIDVGGPFEGFNNNGKDRPNLTVSPDGKTFCGFGFHNSSFNVLRFKDGRAEVSKSGFHTRNMIYAFPTYDGGRLLQYGGVVLNFLLKQMPSGEFEGKFDLTPTDDPRFLFASRRQDRLNMEVAICSSTDLKLLHTLPPFKNVVDRSNWHSLAHMNNVPRLFYLAKQNLVVCLTDEHDRVDFREFDLLSSLRKTEKKFLSVVSNPSPKVELEETFDYSIESLSSSKVEYQLSSGPTGMTVSRGGKVRWVADDRPKTGIQTVVITAKNEEGVSDSHAFEVVVTETPNTRIAGADSNQPPQNLRRDTIIKFPSKFQKFCSGGNGKFLVFYLKDESKLFVLDVMKRAIVKEIAVQGTPVFAANRDKLVVGATENNNLQFWDLTTLKRVKTVERSGSGFPKQAAMGSHGDGPLALYCGGRIELWDTVKMEPMALKGDRLSGDQYNDLEMSVSSDGRTFCGWPTRYSNQHFTVMRVRNNSTEIRQTPDAHSMNRMWMTPNGDGGVFITYNNSIGYDYNVRKLDLERIRSRGVYLFPTGDSRFFAAIRNLDRDHQGVILFTTADFQEILHEEAFDSITGRNDSYTERMDLEPRFRYLHDDKLAVYVCHQNDQVIVRPFDIQKKLEKKHDEFLYVISKPESVVAVGETFGYQIQTLSTGSCTYELEIGPQGMTVDKKGKVVWPVKSRPLGGSVSVAINVENSQGAIHKHTFELFVRRDFDIAKADSKAAESGLVKIDSKRMELPSPPNAFVNGLEQNVLMLSSNKLTIIDSDGWTPRKTVELDKRYSKIVEREKYYLAISEQENILYRLEKKSLNIEKTFPLNLQKVVDIVLHPRLPFCYVSGKKTNDIPRNQFVMIDEKNWSGREDGEWLGTRLAIDPSGGFLVAQYSDGYKKGSRLIMNPTRWHVVPDYGYLEWMIRYRLDRKGVPLVEEVKDRAGGNGQGVKISSDGKRVVYLSYSGYPKGSRNLAGWDSSDFTKIPISYPMKDIADSKQFAFHPYLPLAVSPGKSTAVIFDIETGSTQPDRLAINEQELDGFEVLRAYFSPDGKNLIMDTKLGGVHYLHKEKLNLSRTELAMLKSNKRLGERTVSRMTESSDISLPPIKLSEIDSLRGGLGKRITKREIARAYKASVVVVQSTNSSGTGFLVGSKGYILTCAHCVTDPNSIQVTYDKSKGELVTADAKLLLIDEKADLALLKIERAMKSNPLRLAIGMPVETGESVSVIGHPQAGNAILDYTMTDGIISNPRRVFDDSVLIQTTAAVNPGSSGGPIFNERGLVIGIVVSKANIENAGFGITADEIGRFLFSHFETDANALAIVRDWYNSENKGPLTAYFDRYQRGKVLLRRKSDSKEFRFELEKLSDADQKFVVLLADAIDEQQRKASSKKK